MGSSFQIQADIWKPEPVFINATAESDFPVDTVQVSQDGQFVRKKQCKVTLFDNFNLRAFPFDEYTVLFATVETNDDPAKEHELRAFMRGRGYTFLGHAGVDDYFAWRPAKLPAFRPPLDYSGTSEQRIATEAPL